MFNPKLQDYLSVWLSVCVRLPICLLQLIMLAQTRRGGLKRAEGIGYNSVVALSLLNRCIWRKAHGAYVKPRVLPGRKLLITDKVNSILWSTRRGIILGQGFWTFLQDWLSLPWNSSFVPQSRGAAGLILFSYLKSSHSRIIDKYKQGFPLILMKN